MRRWRVGLPRSRSSTCEAAPLTSRALARHELFDYIERFYNRQRRHTKLGYLSPVQWEKRVDSMRAPRYAFPWDCKGRNPEPAADNNTLNQVSTKTGQVRTA